MRAHFQWRAVRPETELPGEKLRRACELTLEAATLSLRVIAQKVCALFVLELNLFSCHTHHVQIVSMLHHAANSVSCIRVPSHLSLT